MRRKAEFSRLIGVLATTCTLGCQPAQPPAPQLPPAEVTVSRPLQQEVTEALEFTGTTAALESVEVRARVTGFLQEIHFQPRAKVSKGDALFTIDPRPFKASLDAALADLDAKKARLEKAEFDFERFKGLYDQGSATQEEMVKATTDRDALRAAVAAAQAAVENAQLQFDWCQVTAPIYGRIGRNLVDPGNIVAADSTVLASLVNDDDIYVYFNASERDVLTLRERFRRDSAAAGGNPQSQPEIQDLREPAYMGLMTEDGHPHAGVLDYAAPELDPATGTIQVRARIPNPDAVLIPGLFVRVRVPVGQPYSALLVTERALGSDQGQRYLLVVNEKNEVEYRPVKVGTLEHGLRAISAGLKAEDWVIVTGIQRVRPGVTVKPVETPMPVGPAAPLAPTTAPAAGAPAH